MSNLCPDCPAASALQMREAQLGEKPEDMSETKWAMQLNEIGVARRAFNEAAGRIGCRDIVKVLPSEPDIMLEVGSEALIGYVSSCPSFTTYVELRSSDLENS